MSDSRNSGGPRNSPSQGRGRKGGAGGKGRRPGLLHRGAAAFGWARFFKLLLTLLIIGLLGIGYLLIGLPSLDKIDRFDKTQGIRMHDSRGLLIATYGQVVGETVPYKKIPKSLIAALIATEDRRFLHHWGIDPFGMLRAVAVNTLHGEVRQGGSTITQQLAKNVFLTADRNLHRKLQEALLALWLENKFSKEKILELYLNRVYLGAGNYGIDAASRHYFSKPATQLNLQESALLVGLLKAPSRYAPTRDPALARKRTQQVLLNMQDAGALTDKQVKKALANFGSTLKLPAQDSGSMRYFTDWVVDQIPDVVTSSDGDLDVYTTLDSSLQEQAQHSLEAVISKNGAAKKASQAALVTLDNRPGQSGAIRAMIGGVNYGQSQYNRATQAQRQPGSAFKLFVYLAALENGFSPDTTVVDQPVTYGDWTPGNYDNQYHGPMPLQEAFNRSINTVSAQLAHATGPSAIVRMAQRLGIESPLKSELSLALGTNEVNLLELTSAYAALPQNGRKTVPYGITRIDDVKHHTLYRYRADAAEQALSPGIAASMNRMLISVVSYGTGKSAAINAPAGGKTGTTQNYRDAWFMGFDSALTTGVWVGNDDGKSMNKITGGTLPAAIFKGAMNASLSRYPAGGINQYAAPAEDDSFKDIEQQGGFGSWIDNLTGSGDAPPPNMDNLHRNEQPDPFANLPQQPVAPPVQEQTPPPASKENNNGPALGDQFWKTLKDAPVEYEYPGKKRS